MRRIYFPVVSAALLLAIPIFGSAPSAAFDAEAGPLAEIAPRQTTSAPSCPPDASLVHILSIGGAPERNPGGACLLRAAKAGNVVAARMLGDAYAQALIKGTPGSDGDLFGREILWRRAAAASGQPEDEVRLAQAFDFDPQVDMPDQALAYYIRAAHHGHPFAADALGQAWAQGRIPAEQIVDFRRWIQEQAPSNPALRRAAHMLNRAADDGASPSQAA